MTPIIIPSKAKAWVGALGALFTLVGPSILSMANILPPPWPSVVGAIFVVLTWLGIYRAPYKPEGTVIVASGDVPPLQPGTGGGYTNPYRG